MEVSEISLKLAQLTLQAKQTDIISDLIKIGIPSVVALVGTISTIVIALKSHQKDLSIARLNSEKESDKERSRLIVELIKEISVSIGEIDATAIRYITTFGSKTKMNRSPFPAMAELYEGQSTMIYKLHDIFEIETKVLLLGDMGVTDAFKDYNAYISRFAAKYGPDDNADYDKFMQDARLISQKKNILFKELSALYLREGSATSRGE